MAKRKDYPGHIRQRGDSFQVVLTVGGERHSSSLTGATREGAEEYARKEYDRLRKRTRRGGSGFLTMGGLIDAYEESEVPKKAERTQHSYRGGLDVLRHYFAEVKGDPRADHVGPLQVQEFLDWRSRHRFRRKGEPRVKKAPVSARTVAKDRTMLHMVFSWGEALEIVDRNPVARVEPPRQDPREPVILSDAQYERLLEACGREERPFLWLYVLLLGETGLRCDSEALWLRWEAIDLERGFLTVEGIRKGRRTKSGKARVVPLTQRLRDALRDHAAAYRLRTYHGKRSAWVFHHERDRRHATAGERIQRLRDSFDNAVERAELPADLNQHDLRHRRVTKWLAEGKAAHLVQKAMGHSDLRTTLGYEHLVPEDLLQLVEESLQPRAREVGL
ncbi:MAG: site-specific integrase [Gemmatimonadota bacterium]|nr:site-specific integrase [Gemmatimonadota bacterium]